MTMSVVTFLPVAIAVFENLEIHGGRAPTEPHLHTALSTIHMGHPECENDLKKTKVTSFVRSPHCKETLESIVEGDDTLARSHSIIMFDPCAIFTTNRAAHPLGSSLYSEKRTF